MTASLYRPMTLEDAVSDFPGLQRAPATVLVALNAAKGRVLSKQKLREAVEEVIGQRTTDMALSSNCQRARRIIKDFGRIEAATGIGYRLIWDKTPPHQPNL